MIWLIYFAALLISMGIWIAKDSKDHESCIPEDDE
jgi:hypothetical protein